MSEEREDFSTVNSGYVEELDYDNNGVPDWQQDDKPLLPDGYARDINREIIRDPEPFYVDRESVGPTYSERLFDERFVEAVQPFDEAIHADPDDHNLNATALANDRLDIQKGANPQGESGSKPQVMDPDQVLAMTLGHHAHREKEVKRQHNPRKALYDSIRMDSKDPSHSGMEFLMHAAKSFKRGWDAQRARSLALESHRLNQIDGILNHAHRHGLSELAIKHLDKLAPGLSERLTIQDTQAIDGKSDSQQTANRDNPETERNTNKTADSSAQSATEPADAEEKGKTPEIGTSTTTVENQELTQGSGKLATARDADIKVAEIDRPFREPWPYNPRIIEKAINDPAGIDENELIDAYASAKGEQAMLRRLETRIRSITSGVDENKLSGMKIADQRKIAGGIGFGAATEASERLNKRSAQLKTLTAEMKTRGLQTRDIDREIELRTRDLPIVIPGIDSKPMLDQAIILRKKLGLSRFEAEHPINLTPKNRNKPFVPPRGPRAPSPRTAGAGGLLSKVVDTVKDMDRRIQAERSKNQGLER